MTNDTDREVDKPRCEQCRFEIKSAKRIWCATCLRERCRSCGKVIDEVSTHGILCAACLRKLPDKERKALLVAYGYGATAARKNALMALGADYDRATALARGTVADPNADPPVRHCHCEKAPTFSQYNLITGATDEVCNKCGAIKSRGEAQPRRGRRMA